MVITEGPEKMDEFFNARAETYDQHMDANVEDFQKFYRKISHPIPKTSQEIKILDLGCGTGLELEYIFQKAPRARITGVDISEKMLEILLAKYREKSQQITVVNRSYLDFDFGAGLYDYVVSVMTFHHLDYDTKKSLYERINYSLKKVGKYIEGDYVVSKAREGELLTEYNEIKKRDSLYHLDIPFCRETQEKLLRSAGFNKIQLLFSSGESAIFVGEKPKEGP